MATARKNFRRLARWLKERDDVEITTYRELMGVYGAQKGTVTREELRAIASAALASRALAPTADFSPAETFSGLARAIIAHEESGKLPETLSAVHALGPVEMPPERPADSYARPVKLGLEAVRALARAANGHIEKNGALPAALDAGRGPIGTGSLFALFSAVFLDLHSGRPRAEYDVPDFEPYPKTNETRIIGEVEGYKTWPVHRTDLDMSRIAELTRLQLWTLKPARRR
jgi:hypothetical protein